MTNPDAIPLVGDGDPYEKIRELPPIKGVPTHVRKIVDHEQGVGDSQLGDALKKFLSGA